MADLTTLIETEDIAALLFEIDVLCGSGEWDALEDLAWRCRDAVERGRQLWPVASHVDYRLALQAPPAHAAAVLERDARFTLGPLSEVCASTHTFAELEPHLPGAHVAAAVAQERVLRGEDLSGARVPDAFEVPLRLLEGERGHVLPLYRAHDADFPDPDPPADASSTPVVEATAVEVDRATVASVRDLFDIWTAQSNGHCAVSGAVGDSADAIGRIAGAARTAAISAGEALVRLTWAGSGGGMHGRRRGGASGRFHAWWCAAALVGAPWPVEADSAEAEFGRIEWVWWEPVPRPNGLVFGLAASDPDTGQSVAILATDTAEILRDL